MTMTLGHCKDCVYFRESSPATEERPFSIGTCHWDPPKVHVIRMATPLSTEAPIETPATGYRYETIWPTTVGELGCGKFMAREGDH